jgi:hypothetical protein
MSEGIKAPLLSPEQRRRRGAAAGRWRSRLTSAGTVRHIVRIRATEQREDRIRLEIERHPTCVPASFRPHRRCPRETFTEPRQRRRRKQPHTDLAERSISGMGSLNAVQGQRTRLQRLVMMLVALIGTNAKAQGYWSAAHLTKCLRQHCCIASPALDQRGTEHQPLRF